MTSKPNTAGQSASRFRSHVQLVAAGWKQATHEASLTGPVARCYMFDLPTKWIWMCTVDAAAFAQMSVDSHIRPQDAQGLYNAVSEVAGKAAQGIEQAPVEGLSWEQQLGGLLAMYAGTTQVWERAGRMPKGGHFVVLNYRKPGGQDGLLRPFIVDSKPTAVLPSEQLQQAIAQVLAGDQARHPEWFA